MEQQKPTVQDVYISLAYGERMLTQQRQEIIRFIYEHERIDDVEESWMELRKKSHISLATMYSTIRLLVNMGWVSTEEGSGRKKRYLFKG